MFFWGGNAKTQPNHWNKERGFFEGEIELSFQKNLFQVAGSRCYNRAAATEFTARRMSTQQARGGSKALTNANRTACARMYVFYIRLRLVLETPITSTSVWLFFTSGCHLDPGSSYPRLAATLRLGGATRDDAPLIATVATVLYRSCSKYARRFKSFSPDGRVSTTSSSSSGRCRVTFCWPCEAKTKNRKKNSKNNIASCPTIYGGGVFRQTIRHGYSSLLNDAAI